MRSLAWKLLGLLGIALVTAAPAVAAANKLVAAGIVQKTRRRKMERRHLLS